ncbi:MAG: GNAT family N-acetyltransferase [Microvirga sp.]
MPDSDLILGLETRLLNAWPSFDYQFYDGWVLRFANGYSKRANSATPIRAGAGLDGALVDHMVEHFAAAGVRPTFRLTGVEAPGVDGLLQERGFTEIEPTLVLLAEVGGDCGADPEVSIAPKVTRRWVQETARSYGGDKSDDKTLIEIVSRIRQTAGFATLHLDDQPVAWGLGVIERGCVGLYDIVVAPELRGIGLGRRVVSSLMAWGCSQGAHTAYLQVLEANTVARSLYGALGFAPAYRYVHRIMPAGSIG